MPMWVVLVEDRHGQQAYGPFSSVYAAEQWADETVINLDWKVCYMENPF